MFRDELAKYRPVDFASRLLTGCASGGVAAIISCPFEVTLVRCSNDATLPVESRRNYKGVVDAYCCFNFQGSTIAIIAPKC